MTVIVTLCFWLALGSSWGLSCYLYYCGVINKPIDSRKILLFIIIGFVAMAFASVGNTITQGAYLSSIYTWR